VSFLKKYRVIQNAIEASNKTPQNTRKFQNLAKQGRYNPFSKNGDVSWAKTMILTYEV